MATKKKYIYTFGCYEELLPTGVQRDYCSVDIWSDNFKEAQARVKTLVNKKEYDLYQVIEKREPADDRPRYVVVVQCHNQMMSDGNLLDNVLVELWDDSPANVIERAKKIIKRKFYRIKNIVEKLPNEK